MARKKKPIQIITLDTETVGLDGDMRRIAIYAGKEPYFAYALDELDIILTQYAQHYIVHIYIHNLEFDIRKLKDFFKRYEIAWGQCMIINGKYVKIVTKDFVLHDSFHLLPFSLKELSENFDLENGKLDLWEEVKKTYSNEYKDSVDFLARCPLNDKLYLEYLGYDVIALYELLYKFCDISGLDVTDIVKCLTPASISKSVFKHGYKGKQFISEGQKLSDFELLTLCETWDMEKMLEKSDTSITYKEVESKLRQAYFGGRCEVFKPVINWGYGYHQDVNSEYPYVMSNKPFPIGYPEYYSTPKRIEQIFDKFLKFGGTLGFIYAEVFIPYQHIPPLPIKKDKLFFPCGRVEGWFSYAELEYAVTKCGVVVERFVECIHFVKTFPVFKNFVQTFYRLKEEGKKTGNKPLTQFAKLLLNTAYGWTALRRDKPALDSVENLEKRSESLLSVHDDLGMIEYLGHINTDSIQVQIAATVTSYARLVLLQGLHTASEKGDVYYCDTDSIVSRETLPPNMIDKYRLGAWDLETVIVGDALFLQPKVYFENADGKENTVKFKGVSRETQRNLDIKFYRMLYSELCDQQKDRLLVEKNKSLFRSVLYSQKVGRDLNKLEYRDKYINLHSMQKRIVDYSRNFTQPYYFNSLQDFRQFTFKADYSSIADGNGCIINVKG